MTISTEPRHPIGVVAERTGLTPDVLRVWERRYNVVAPQRSAGGQRLYSDSDISRLNLLTRATRGGHGIGHVARLTNRELEELSRDQTQNDVPRAAPAGDARHPAIGEAMAYTQQLNPVGLERLLRKNVVRYGITGFLDGIAGPFLRAVGDAWHEGKLTISQEHLATAVVERVVGETAPLLSGGEDNPAIVIATLEGERHSAGALMAAATAASEGWKVIYLGADLPASEIVEMAKRTRAKAVGISIVVADRKARMAAELRELEGALGSTTLLVGGAGAASFHAFSEWTSAIFVESVSDLVRELSSISSRGSR